MKYKTILWILIFLSSFSVPRVFGQIKQELGNQDGWSYGQSRAGINDKDHKMSVLGWLYFNNTPMPVNLQRRDILIINSLGTFQYKILQEDFGDRGWFKISDIKLSDAAEGKDTFSNDDLTRGFYFASLKDKRKATPAAWIFIQGQGGGQWTAWVDPNRLADFADTLLYVPPIIIAK